MRAAAVARIGLEIRLAEQRRRRRRSSPSRSARSFTCSARLLARRVERGVAAPARAAPRPAAAASTCRCPARRRSGPSSPGRCRRRARSRTRRGRSSSASALGAADVAQPRRRRRRCRPRRATARRRCAAPTPPTAALGRDHLLDERVPLAARVAAALPLGVLGAALGAAVDGLRFRHAGTLAVRAGASRWHGRSGATRYRRQRSAPSIIADAALCVDRARDRSATGPPAPLARAARSSRSACTACGRTDSRCRSGRCAACRR